MWGLSIATGIVARIVAKGNNNPAESRLPSYPLWGVLKHWPVSMPDSVLI